MKKKLIFNVFAISLFLIMAESAAALYFNNVEMNSDNVFSSGTLNLTIDGVDTNVIKFQVFDMKPGQSESGFYTIANTGSLNGFLSIDSVQVYDCENGCEEDEVNAGDSSCGEPGLGQGEFARLVNAQFFLDYNCDEGLDPEDKVFYSGLVCDLAEKYDLNYTLKAGNAVCIGAVFSWLQSQNDDLAQGDSFSFDLSFKLIQ